MPFSPPRQNREKLPVFQSEDPGLALALNTLARAIDSIELPDVRISGGTQEWSGESVILRPDPAPPSVQGPAIPPLTIVSTKPTYIQPPESVVAEGSQRFYLTWGFVNSKRIDDWSDPIDIVLSGGTRYIVLKVSLVSDSTVSDSVQDAEVVVWSSYDEETDPAWDANGNRPSHFFIPLGTIFVEEFDGTQVVTIVNIGRGSISVSEHISDIKQSVTEGFSFQKRLNYIRQAY